MDNKQSYIDVVNRFNAINGFEIVLPKSDEMYKKLAPLYLETIERLIIENTMYEKIRTKNFSDDHLATEIGLMVYKINRKTNA